MACVFSNVQETPAPAGLKFCCGFANIGSHVAGGAYCNFANYFPADPKPCVVFGTGSNALYQAYFRGNSVTGNAVVMDSSTGADVGTADLSALEFPFTAWGKAY